METPESSIETQFHTNYKDNTNGTGWVAKCANLLRTLGALAVVLSAVVYMLQGIEGVDDALRDWIYVVLMMVLTVGGIGCHVFLKDSIGARLFFALSAMLVPVQISQLSALWTTQTAAAQWSAFAPWLGVLVASLVASSISVYLCFSVVARPHARILTGAYVLLNMCLLAPWRDLATTSMVLVVMILIYSYLHYRTFTKDRRFMLWEGVLVRLMMIAPLTILIVRFAFSVDSVFGWGLVLESVALCVWLLSFWLLKWGMYKTTANFIGWLIALLGNVTFVYGLAFYTNALPSEFSLYALFVPGMGLTLVVSRLSQSPGLYHIAAALGMIALAACVPHFDWVNGFVMLILSVVLFFTALVIQSRLLLLTGLISGVIQLVMLLVIAAGNIQAVSWLMLAVSGVILVSLASVAERYGRELLRRSEKSLKTVNAWGV